MPTKQLGLLSEFSSISSRNVVNVSSVPQRSPFRFPGGKTWLIPVVRRWLNQSHRPHVLFEPFCGGGIVGLTAAFENLATKVVMMERDEEIAAVWKTILGDSNDWLANRIINFDLTHENAHVVLNSENKKIRDIAFCTILKNRIFHGGIIAKGSGMLKNGENGKGIFSRWYPETLYKRIKAIDLIREKVEFIEGDAFELIGQNLGNKENWFFIDPPYTIAGKRLYTYFEVDHDRLFYLVKRIKGKFMMTYDDTPEIRKLANLHDLKFTTIPMKTTHHLEKREIIISDNFGWW